MTKRLSNVWLLAALWFATPLTLAAGEPKTEAEPWAWENVQRIVAVGDVHGDYQQFVKSLKAAKVINDDENWIAGRTHLVQNGDVLDRGPESKKAMDLLRKLEKQALEAGGRVHPLLGNHEMMVMLGDFRYVHPGELAAFGGLGGYKGALSRDGEYGTWLRSHNAVIKINNVLFMHGGLAAHWGKLTIPQMNAQIRKFLRGEPSQHGHALVGRDGPAWYRGWCTQDGAAVAKQCDDLFRKLQVRHAVVGHTPQRGITAFGYGRVIAIDSGMCAHYGGPASALVIENGKFFAVFPGNAPKPLNVHYYDADQPKEPLKRKKAG